MLHYDKTCRKDIVRGEGMRNSSVNVLSPVIDIRTKRVRAQTYHSVHRYSYLGLSRTELLITGYERRRISAEFKTCTGVAKCQEQVTAEVKKIFEVSENKSLVLAKELLSKKSKLERARLLSVAELEQSLDEAERLIRMGLGARFKAVAHSLDWGLSNDVREKILRSAVTELEQGCALIEKWRELKQGTVFVTEQAGIWSRKAWNCAAESIFQNQVAVELMEVGELGPVLLESVGVNARWEKEEFLAGLVRRIQGVLILIRMRLSLELNQELARVFYHVHDQFLDSRLESKIGLLVDRLDRAEQRQLAL